MKNKSGTYADPQPEGFDAHEAIKAQRAYCDRLGVPFFAPESGRCWSCHAEIFKAVEIENPVRYNPETRLVEPDPNPRYMGISVSKASMSLITGCPHCNRTYVD